jgi:hypothetical protein
MHLTTASSTSSRYRTAQAVKPATRAPLPPLVCNMIGTINTFRTCSSLCSLHFLYVFLCPTPLDRMILRSTLWYNEPPGVFDTPDCVYKTYLYIQIQVYVSLLSQSKFSSSATYLSFLHVVRKSYATIGRLRTSSHLHVSPFPHHYIVD